MQYTASYYKSIIPFPKKRKKNWKKTFTQLISGEKLVTNVFLLSRVTASADKTKRFAKILEVMPLNALPDDTSYPASLMLEPLEHILSLN